MPAKTTTKDLTPQLIKELKTLSEENRKLAKEVKKVKSLEFMQIFKSPFKFMWFSFLKGLMVGLGTVLGASVLVAIVVYLLSKISFVPIIGDFVENILQEVKGANEVNEQVIDTKENYE